MDLWRVILTQQLVQWHSTSVTQVWFLRGKWEPCALRPGGVQTLLVWVALNLPQELLHVNINHKVILILAFKNIGGIFNYIVRWKCLKSFCCHTVHISNLPLQLIVMLLLHHKMELWRTTLTQQRVQRYSTAVIQVCFQRGWWELNALGMGGIQNLLVWAAL